MSLKVDTPIVRKAGPGVAVIVVSPDALVWVREGVRSPTVLGEVEGAR